MLEVKEVSQVKIQSNQQGEFPSSSRVKRSQQTTYGEEEDSDIRQMSKQRMGQLSEELDMITC
jgi:hypothetical protein